MKAAKIEKQVEWPNNSNTVKLRDIALHELDLYAGSCGPPPSSA
jgi:hypothetical protein